MGLPSAASSDPADDADEIRLREYASALADAVDAALPRWVERSVERVLGDAGRAPDSCSAEARDAGARAAAEVGPQVRALLGLDIDEQRTNPLALLRRAVAYPTAVLERAGVPPVARDETEVRLFPGDVYSLTPASFADIDAALHEPGLAWGAAKAFVHLKRRRADEARRARP
jgi:hypothetical protein